ncbi:transferase [Streptomyces sp. UNOB3_S3]|uniref:transferase n=1 Tax=Streptomyces sp. UNOB3_S3 TaxID=2871682 RepID=UPI001E33C89B|nr:transferase [Streptomyces sp. UNOB3_S3]MCC3777029.1 transferase [Streptomyces sp. UNOB3_S3]
MASVLLGDYVAEPLEEQLATTPYGAMGGLELRDFLAGWEELHRRALAKLAVRVHPSAFVHPSSIIGDDVIIGPGARVHEFSTVRKGSVLCAGASVGFNCEVTRTFVGEGAVLGHRIGLNSTVVGARAHLSANVMVAAISMWSQDMRHPEKEIFFRVPGGLYRCGTSAFGALIGDDVQTGSSISLGPGVALGRGCRVTGGVLMAAMSVPAQSVLSTPGVTDARVRRRR